MNSFMPEQLIAAQKTGFETTFSFLTKALEGTENLIELNVQAVKSTLSESQEILVKAFAAKDPQELFALQAGQAQASAEKVQSYWRHGYEIVSGTQAEFAATAEAQLKQQQNNAQAFFDHLQKDAPAGYETALAAWKALFKTANEASSATYEAAKKATKQVVAIAESNDVTAASSASPRRTRQAVVAVDAVEK